jgi:O-antigen/teichoic acid export membrane protein
MNAEVVQVNNIANIFIRNFSYTLSSNLISLVISTLVVLVIPKLIGVEEYGYWQLYLFYSAYVGFLHFGWSDGIYLRYGGKEYDKLNKPLFFSQFYMLVTLQILIGFIITFIPFFYNTDSNRVFIFQMVAINLTIVNSKSMLLFILQGTNRLKEYAKITIIDRLFYTILIALFLLLGIREYKLMIVADLIGKFLSLVYSMYCCKDLVIRNINLFYLTLRETIENISVGIKLMFANIASMLIIGVVRFGIERSWDLNTFAKISLTLSISNFLLIFINTIGIVVFPILRRTSKEKLPSIYVTIRDFLMVFLFGFLITYYPIKEIFSLWLPQYSESLKYMALLFPMFIFEGKNSLLINTYLKTLRAEKVILKVNLITLCLSILLTLLTTYFIKNLDITIISIVILLAIRSILSEVYVANYLKLSVFKDVALEIIMSIAFIGTSWYLNSWKIILIYGISFLIYLFIKRKDLKNNIQNIKNFLKK